MQRMSKTEEWLYLTLPLENAVFQSSVKQGKVVAVKAEKTERGGCVAAHINFDTRRRRVVSLTIRPLHPRYPFTWEAVWVPGPASTF